MNWYSKLKQADFPLPSFDYKDPNDEDRLRGGFHSVDSDMTEEDAKKQEQKHPKLTYEGSGSYGVAFVNEGNMVIKYTTHYSEFASANHILILQEQLGGRIPGFVKVIDTEKLKNDVFAIVMEKLEPLNNKEQCFVKAVRTGAYSEFENDPFFLEVSTKYEKMLFDIDRSGGDPWDAHRYNIGKLPNGQYVMFDLGGLFE